MVTDTPYQDVSYNKRAGIDPEFQQDAARVFELAEKAMDTWTVLDTDFLAPPVVWAATAALGNVAGLAMRAWGGYSQVWLTTPDSRLPPPLMYAPLHVPQTITNVALWARLPFTQSQHQDGLCAQAERCRLILGREESIPPVAAEDDGGAAPVPPEIAERVAAVELQGNFMFDPVRSPCAACRYQLDAPGSAWC